MPAIDAQQFSMALEGGAICLDLRAPASFAGSHIPGSVNLQFGRQDLGERAELFLPMDREYLILMEPAALGPIAEKLLTQAGYRVRGFLQGGLKAWEQSGRPLSELLMITVHDLHRRLSAGEQLALVDVREDFEFDWAHIEGTHNLPHGEIWQRSGELDPGLHWHVICNDQVRSSAAASVLRHLGRGQVTLVLGGTAGWLEAGYSVVRAG